MFQCYGSVAHVLTALAVVALSTTAHASGPKCKELFKSKAESAVEPSTPAPFFAGELMSQILKTQPDTNVVIPTASVDSVLTMVALAAGEQTASRAELSRALNLQPGIESQTLAENYGKMLKQMQASGDGVQSPIVRMVNAIFVNPVIRISDHYATAMRDHFGAAIAPATPADVSRVNDIVKEVTKNKVTKVMDGFNPNMRSVLVSVSYIEAAWQKGFKVSATRPAPFHPSGKAASDSYDVNMMSAVSSVFGTAETTQAQVVELPFRGQASASGMGSRYSAIILLPKDGQTLESVLATSDLALSTALQRKENVMTHLQAPKFSFEWKGDLLVPLQGMGVRSPFEKSDFLNLTDASNDFYVSQARAAAFLDFNETGFAGGGAAAMEFSTRGMGPQVEKSVKVDRPFVLVIRDNDLGRSMLTAAVVRPNASGAAKDSATSTAGGVTPRGPVSRGGGWR